MKAHRPPAPTLAALRAHREEILRLAAAHDARNVRVFGSVAREQARPDSDVDLLVDVDSSRRGFARFASLQDLGRDLRELLGVPVDVISISVESPRAAAILDEAVPL